MTPQEAWNQQFGGGTSNIGGLSVTSTRTPGNWVQGYSGVGGTVPGYQSTPDINRQTYSGQGGDFTRTQAGNDAFSGWKDASGRVVSDLPGYLNMRGQQSAGSNFTGNLNRLNRLISNPSSIQNDPSYRFRLDEGNRAINRSAAAKGMLNSGNVLAELAQYGQGMASQEYGNQFNRLSDLIGQQQNFGISSGYYSSDPRQSPFGLSYTIPSTSIW